MGKKIVLNSSDYKKLINLIQVYKVFNKLKSEHLKQLARELENATVTDDPVYIDSIVRINSTVVITNLESGSSEMVTVVFPAESSQDGSRISILSPLGTSLIGESENSVTECLAPEGKIPFRIEKIIAHHAVIRH